MGEATDEATSEATGEVMGELDPAEEDPFGVLSSSGGDSKGRDDPD